MHKKEHLSDYIYSITTLQWEDCLKTGQFMKLYKIM